MKSEMVIYCGHDHTKAPTRHPKAEPGTQNIRTPPEIQWDFDRLRWAIFLASRSRRNTDGRLSVRSINTNWNEVCSVAGVEGKTPHSARHAMGRHIIEKTGNVSAVQRQLGHKNAAYSLQYTSITAEEIDGVLNDRD